MPFAVGDCVGIRSVRDTGLVVLVHPNDRDHDVDRDHARQVGTFAEDDLFPLRDGARIKVTQRVSVTPERQLVFISTFRRRGAIRRVETRTYRIVNGHNMGRYPRG